MSKNAQVGSFRADINGLRAWAVLAVVLYHFNVPGFSGGFSGVDVFFVISGYLMASIVVGGLERERFELWGFYLSRARRIIPALLFVVATVLIVGWFLLMPYDYQVLGRHARESVFFMSNLRFMSEAGYFDTAANSKWLLHTWSLSVEWQFYLLYPVILLVFYRFFRSQSNLLFFHLAGLLLFFALSVHLSLSEPTKAFFWLPSRCWELLAGGVVFFVVRRLYLSYLFKRVFASAGMLLISLSMFWIDSSLSWPAPWALAAVLGTSLVILAGDQAFFLTSARPMQWLGERSYSLYLWHWPVVVLLAYLGLENSQYWIAFGILASLLFAQFSYHVIELPARQRLALYSSRRTLVMILLAALFVAASAQMVRRSGIPERLPEEIYVYEQERKNKNPRQDECLDDEARCTFGGSRIRAFLLGDSHADALVTGVASALDSPEDGIAFRGVSSCLFVFGAKSSNKGGNGCEKLREGVLRELSERGEKATVLIVNRTSVYALGRMQGEGNSGAPLVYFEAVEGESRGRFLEVFRQEYVSSVCALTSVAEVYLVRPIPEMEVNVPRYIGRQHLLGRDTEVKLPVTKYRERHAYVWSVQDEAATQCGAKLLDPLPYLCDEYNCFGSEGGLPLYVDDDHLSERGNRKLVPMFRSVFDVAKVADRPRASANDSGF
jgi:peptidoglycan/LPS O-acetylase OafA/YrhL